MTFSHSLHAAVFAGALALAGCSDGPPPRAMPAQPMDETFMTFGDYEVHFNALRTDELSPDIARTYDIRRSNNRVLLNVTVLHQEGAGLPRRPIPATVSVDAYNLNGQLKDLKLRQISEGDAIYYIGEVGIAGTEILVFDIKVTPNGHPTTYSAKMKREFVAG